MDAISDQIQSMTLIVDVQPRLGDVCNADLQSDAQCRNTIDETG
jgi:hypothetical protein